MRPPLLRTSLILCLALVLGACGFKLRGSFTLPYQSLHISLPANSPLGADLRRQIRANQPDLLVDDPKKAEAVFQQVGEKRERIIAAMNAEGRAREYQLRLRYSFRLVDGKGTPLTPVNEIVLAREITYDDNQVLAKNQEEEFLWQSMQQDLAQQILRRLTARQAQQPPVEEEDY